MTETSAPSSASSRPVRDVADDFVRQLAELDPLVATDLGLPIRQDELPDLSPAGLEAKDELQRAVLARLAGSSISAIRSPSVFNIEPNDLMPNARVDPSPRSFPA